MYNRISQLFSALKPSPSNANTNSKMSNHHHHNNGSPSNNSHDDDEMSADLLSQQSPPATSAAAKPSRPSLRSDACVWNSTRKQPPKNNTTINNEEKGGRPSFQSNEASCHSTNKKCVPTNDVPRYGASPPNNNHNTSMQQRQEVEHTNRDKKMEEPWRNYGKSYARLSARNPVNYAVKASAAAAANYNPHDETAEKVEGKPTPPSSKKKKTHKLMRRLQQHHTTTKLLNQHNNSSSHSSSTKHNDQNNNYNNIDTPSKGHPTYNNQSILPASLTSGHASSSHVGQEIEIVNHRIRNNENNLDNEEYYEEFSPLTCGTLSQANFFRGEMTENEEEEVAKGDRNDEERQEHGNEQEDEEEGSRRQFQTEKDYESSSKAASDHPTLVKYYTAALKASSNIQATHHQEDESNNNNNNANAGKKKRGTKRKQPTALDLALIEESTKHAAAATGATSTSKTKNGSSGRNNKRRYNKFKAVDAALAEKEDSQTPPYDVPTPRNVEEEEEEQGKTNEEHVDDRREDHDVSMGNNDEVNFFPSREDDEQEEETGTTEKQSEPLLSSLSGKQSEALLSSPSIHPQTETIAATCPTVTATTAAAAATATGPSEITTDELVNNLRDICENLGKALTCPICQASLREAQLLPCCHAFCKSCLAKTFNPPRSKGRKKKGSSPPPTAFKHCPTCKNPADRRSVVPIPQLDDQVRAYKQILVAFGITPYVYGEGIAMTQLDPEDNGGMVLDEVDRLQCLQASRTVNGVEARNLERAQANAAAAAAAATIPKPSEVRVHPRRKSRSSSSQQPPQQQQLRLTKEQMKSQNELRRWQQVAKEQENVVKVNENALNKVKEGRAHQLVQRKLVQAETAKFLAAVNDGADDSKPAAVDKTVDDTAADGGDKSDDDVDFCTAPDNESMEYDTAKESQGLSTTITTAGPSPMVINDGNTVKKSERSNKARTSTIPGSRVLDLEASPEAQKKKKNEGRDSFGTVGTGNASPIVVHDGNTVRKTRPGNKDKNVKSSESHEDKTPRSSGNFLRCEGVAMKRAGNVDTEEGEDEESEYGAETQPLFKSAPLKSGSQDDDDESEYGAETQPIIGKPAAKPALKPAAKPEAKCAAKSAPAPAHQNPIAASIDEPAHKEEIVKGSIVMVQARTWPGINKQGGVGRVTKVHSGTATGGSAVQYDVSYVLGGKEKFVDESFVHLHNPNDEENTTGVSSARKSRKSSEKMVESRRPKRTQQKVSFKEEVRIYNEEELKHIPAEALEWAGIVPKKGKGGKKASGKKRALADSNSNTTPTVPSTKKQKAAPAVSAAASKKTAKKTTKPKKAANVEVEQESRSSAAEALMAMAHDNNSTAKMNEIISPLSTQEIVQCADERYSSLLSASGGSDGKLVLNVVTSNLSNEESDSLKSLSKLLKKKNVSLKLLASFKATKSAQTHLCITSASIENQSNPPNVVSNARTMKVMQATLAGIPILCPLWVKTCLSKGEIIAPTGNMSVRTLPRKQNNKNDGCDDRFGVAKYAASFQKGMRTNTLLSGVEVLMCGFVEGSMKKDIKGLLQAAGATIISSHSDAYRCLSDLTSSEVDKTFVFLCDDTPTNSSCGISEKLHTLVKNICDDSEDANIMAIHFSWLFDCISCATVMPATSYEPIAPLPKAMWRLLTVGVEAAEEDEGKRSQFY